MVEKALHNNRGSLVAIAGSIIALALLGLGISRMLQPQATSQPAGGAMVEPQRVAVAALGRLEPEGEVFRISGPTGERVGKLDVQEGDVVSAGQAIAYLESYDQWLAERNLAAAQLEEAQRRLRAETNYGQAQVSEAEARIQQVDRPASYQIEAQQATIRRLEAELTLVQTDLERFEGLYEEGAIARQQLDQQATETRRVEEELQNAEATLVQIEEDRSTGMSLAEQQLQSAEADLTLSQVQVTVASTQQNLELAEARLERTIIRAPRDGQILRIIAKQGEAITSDGILDFGDTSQMYVVAEVYETDVGLLSLGQPAQINSRNGAFDEALTGEVAEIGWQVFKNDVLDDDPAANADARVVEVKIRLDDSAPVQGLTNLQVDVRIDVDA
ncbi:MAG: HlyD family efflux transporter periplasmic adaptor subunit [Cyanobacteria bacterium P01_A01_bin.37]